MKKIILIGGSEAGKTSLIQGLLGKKIEYVKTQTLRYYENILDTPGEYLENPRFYNSLLVSSYKYDLVGLVQDSSNPRNLFPPNFASMFGHKEVVGIITKVDLELDILRAKKYLEYAGAKRIIPTSVISEDGLKELKDFLVDG